MAYYQLAIIRNTSDCEYLPCRQQLANAQVLKGLCWSPRMADIENYLETGQYKSWIYSGEDMVIHNLETGKIKRFIPASH